MQPRAITCLRLALALWCITSSAPAQDSVRTLAGLPETPGSADGTNTTARFNDPAGLAIAADGTIFVADNQNHAIRRIGTNGVVTTLAGLLGMPGSADGSGTTARFDSPTSLAFGPDGVLYVSDTGNHTIRRVTTNGVVTTLAGSAGNADYADGPATSARFNQPLGLAVAPDDVDAMVAAITRLAGDASLRESMGTAGRAFVERHGSARDAARAYAALVSDSLSDS